MRAHGWRERALNAAIVIAAIGCAAAWIRYLVFQPATPPMISAGDSVKDVPSVAGLPDSPALLLVVSSKCRFCEESMPFYRTLVQQMRQEASTTSLIVVGWETEEALNGYLGKHGVEPNAVLAAAALPSHWRVTPTLLLLTTDKTVERVWRGRLPPHQETEVLDALGLRRLM